MRQLLLAGFALTAIASSVEAAVDLRTNPLSAPWTGPYGGVPPFDKVQLGDFEPVLDAAMAAKLAELDAIAKSTQPPTFDNTIAAMERSGAALERAGTMYSHLVASMSTPAVPEDRAAHGAEARRIR